MTYYHFIPANKRLSYGDGRVVKVGKTYKVDCKPVLCESGLHACKRLIDALGYAPGPILCKVELGGTIIHDLDKSVATERTVVAMADVSDVLRDFARRCALDVIHLWDAPDVVVRYLKTGDENLRDAARAAAWAATWDATWDAARTAARTAARAAGAAAWAAAGTAAWDAAGDAAGAARAARAAAGAAAREKQNRRLVSMVRKAEWEVLG